jgi:hypothetical protein
MITLGRSLVINYDLRISFDSEIINVEVWTIQIKRVLIILTNLSWHISLYSMVMVMIHRFLLFHLL